MIPSPTSWAAARLARSSGYKAGISAPIAHLPAKLGHAAGEALPAALAVRPEQVVQLDETSCGRLAAERSVWALMVVSPQPAVKRGSALR